MHTAPDVVDAALAVLGFDLCNEHVRFGLGHIGGGRSLDSKNHPMSMILENATMTQKHPLSVLLLIRPHRGNEFRRLADSKQDTEGKSGIDERRQFAPADRQCCALAACQHHRGPIANGLHSARLLTHSNPTRMLASAITAISANALAGSARKMMPMTMPATSPSTAIIALRVAPSSRERRRIVEK